MIRGKNPMLLQKKAGWTGRVGGGEHLLGAPGKRWELAAPGSDRGESRRMTRVQLRATQAADGSLQLLLICCVGLKGAAPCTLRP